MFSAGENFRTGLLFAALCGLLAARLSYLQLVDGPRLARLSLGGRVQEIPWRWTGARSSTQRRAADEHRPAFQPGSLSALVADRGQTAEELAVLTGLDAGGIVARLESEERPFKLKSDMDAASAQKINARRIPA
jgi:peptidoglycan glycosyltransferase/penicillin-binding protein 2